MIGDERTEQGDEVGGEETEGSNGKVEPNASVVQGSTGLPGLVAARASL